MPNFKRRGFLQLLGAAAVTPLLPPLPARAVTAGGVSASKALWASLYANAGSAPKFVGVARGMGLSNAAIQGVGARTIGVQIALGATTQTVTQVAAKPLSASPSLKASGQKAARYLNKAIDRSLMVENVGDERGENLTHQDSAAETPPQTNPDQNTL